MTSLKKLFALGAALLLIVGSNTLRAATDDPFPDVNPYGFYGSMIMTVKVTEDGKPCEKDVVVAVYAGDQIRGKGSPKDSANPGAIYLDVYGNDENEQLYFMLLVGGHLVELHPNLQWHFNAVVGTPLEPYILEVGDAIVHEYGTDGSCTVCGHHSYTGIMVTTSDGAHTVSFNGTSEQTVSIPMPITACQVVYERSFKVGKPMSIFLPFPITKEMAVSGGKFYCFSGITQQEDKWVATMTLAKELEANRPYLIMPDAELLTIDFCGQQVVVQTEVKEPVVIDGWSLCGTYEKLEWNETSNDYGIPNNESIEDLPHKFIRLTAGDYILPLHCYLSCRDVPSDSPARRVANKNLPDSIEVVFVDGSVGIEPIDNGQLLIDNDADAWYDLSGRRLNSKPTHRGIYMHGGNKVLVH